MTELADDEPTLIFSYENMPQLETKCDKMKTCYFLTLTLLGLSSLIEAKEHYWWMKDPSVFGQNKPNAGGNNNNLIQKPAQSQQPPEQKYPSFPVQQQQQATGM